MRKNFRKIPKHIIRSLETLQGDSITVYAFLKMSKQDIMDGKYDHLRVSLTNSSLAFPEYLIPDSSCGRYCKYNTEGRVIPLKNLPKIPVSHTFESPNFGDSSKGYHSTTITHEVWQKQIIPPHFYAIIFSQVRSDNEDDYVLKAYVDTPLIKPSLDFNDDLLFQCNLLQENIRTCEITDSNIVDQKYTETQYVNWELLPPGEIDIDNIVSKMLNPRDISNPTAREFIRERLLFFNSLGAVNYIKGSNLLSSYTGAKFPNNVVLLESFDYGNAVYIIKDNWESLSRLSRTELLTNHKKDIIRIKHTINWKNNIEFALQSLLN